MFAPSDFSDIIRMAQSKQGRTIAAVPPPIFSTILFDKKIFFCKPLYISDPSYILEVVDNEKKVM